MPDVHDHQAILITYDSNGCWLLESGLKYWVFKQKHSSQQINQWPITTEVKPKQTQSHHKAAITKSTKRWFQAPLSEIVVIETVRTQWRPDIMAESKNAVRRVLAQTKSLI